MSAERPVADAESLTEPWWEATKNDQFLIQRCRDCSNYQHYPRPVCLKCSSTDLEYVPSSGRGEIYSFTVIHRAMNPAFEAPYVVALVRLSEGPVTLGNIIDVPLDDLRCDLPVTVMWEDLPDGRKLPLWTST